MENNVKNEQQEFTAPVEAAVEQQVEKKPWRKTRWGKALIAVGAIVLVGVGGYVMFKKRSTTETADNAVEVEEQKDAAPRESNNFNRRERFEQRRKEWNN